VSPANEAGDKQTAQPTTTQDAARNYQAQQPAISTAAVFVVLVLVLALMPLAQATGEEQAAHTPATDDTPADQKPQESAVLTVLFVFVLVFVLVFVFVLVLVLALTSLAHKVCQEQPTHTPAA
jgi:ABC-type Fe3+ transport system permease subunit